MTVAETLAEWALGLRVGDVPGEAVRAACRHLLDGFGTALAAVRTSAAPYATAPSGNGGAGAHSATIIGDGRRAAAQEAALANGTLVHALDFDDTHTEALVHATAAVLPAAFAVGESTGATGAEVLTAAVAGYEIVTRLGAAIPHAFHARGIHATSACGVFASAAIASRLMGLGAHQTVNALGIAGSTASGSLEFLNTGSSTKQLHPGLAGMNGIVAAHLAAAGAEGPASIFEGEHGLYRSLAGRDVDPPAVTDGLGTRWEITRITIKPYPACQLSHAALDALASLKADLDTEQIDTIEFELPPDSIAIVCEPAEPKRRPRTPYEGKFSLPYCAAALLVDGALDIGSFDPAQLRRPDVLDLAARVRWRARAHDGAPADAPGVVPARTRDGIEHHATVAHSRGGPDLPLTDGELLAKFASNAGAVADEVAKRVLALAGEPDVRALMAATTIPKDGS